ncbi:MAG: 1-acyl-sn-glycerol-3-phosphate acyltransferase [Chloroflexi bacterium]|jgi:1-acyl-sn-glycerol-3-phosphate acyltransferase|nr:1-acyl-sn-glycerol-3-phosphate acyltransferase [Chloroflexota bacterium]
MRQNATFGLKYPRNQIMRGILRVLGRVIFSIFFRIEISGKENFPKSGPVILVGNHNAAIEGALMVLYTPWQVEMLGAGDIPQETITEILEALYLYIPIRRGHIDRNALQKALDVLRQGGMLGIFPEGGVWNPGKMRPQTGVSWLSYRSQAPILPIAFSGTMGALDAALKFRRPRLTIHIGETIPAAKLPNDQPRKAYFEQYAEDVLSQVRALLPDDDPARSTKICDEHFSLELTTDGTEIPAQLQISQGEALAKLLHRPLILTIFSFNLGLPTGALEQLDQQPTASEIRRAVAHILAALEGEYPYLLTYRFGPKKSEAMLTGLKELLSLAQWAEDNALELRMTPIWRYTDATTGEEITHSHQTQLAGWM